MNAYQDYKDNGIDVLYSIPSTTKNFVVENVPIVGILRNGDKITSPIMHHSFRPHLPDLWSQKFQNSLLFLQLLWSEIGQIWPKSARLLGEVISSPFLTLEFSSKLYRFVKAAFHFQHIAIIYCFGFVRQGFEQVNHAPVGGRCIGDQPWNSVFTRRLSQFLH